MSSYCLIGTEYPWKGLRYSVAQFSAVVLTNFFTYFFTQIIIHLFLFFMCHFSVDGGCALKSGSYYTLKHAILNSLLVIKENGIVRYLLLCDGGVVVLFYLWGNV